jgi:hypothetical protein
MHDGVEMVTEIVEFMNDIKKKSPRLIFKPNDRMKFGYMQADAYHYAKGGFDVYSDDAPDSKIGMIYLENNNPYNYCVMSRLITNAKYSHWNGVDHRTKKSKHKANALKTALKVLKPVQLFEVFEEEKESVEHHIYKARNQLASSIQDIVMRLPRHAIHSELVNLIKMGYTPVNSDIKKAMDFIDQNQDKLRELQEYKPEYALVRVYTDRVEYAYKSNQEVKTVSEIAKLPEELAGKMFVLNITEENKFVEQVGIKRPNSVYWVVL